MTERYKHTGRRMPILLLLALLIVAAPLGVGYMLKLPQTGKDTYSKSGATVDMSNASQGYIMVKRESKKQQRLKVSMGKKEYTYAINGNGTYEVIPLQMGSGTYNLTFYEQKSGNQYAAKFRDKSIKVALEDDDICYYYPNQYVNYDENTKAVAIAAELCEGLTGDLDKYKAVAAYIKQMLAYDYMKALQVVGGEQDGYLPDVDEILERRMGICFDFAAVAAAMLRSQGVATRMVIGYAGKTYHAWNQVLIDGKWAHTDLTFAVTNTKLDVSDYVEERIY